MSDCARSQIPHRWGMRGGTPPSAEVLAEELQGPDPRLAGGVAVLVEEAGVVRRVREELDRDARFPQGLLEPGDDVGWAGRVALGEVTLHRGREARPVGLLRVGRYGARDGDKSDDVLRAVGAQPQSQPGTG